jgi:hypothetical protein
MVRKMKYGMFPLLLAKVEVTFILCHIGGVEETKNNTAVIRLKSEKEVKNQKQCTHFLLHSITSLFLREQRKYRREQRKDQKRKSNLTEEGQLQKETVHLLCCLREPS